MVGLGKFLSANMFILLFIMEALPGDPTSYRRHYYARHSEKVLMLLCLHTLGLGRA